MSLLIGSGKERSKDFRMEDFIIGAEMKILESYNP